MIAWLKIVLPLVALAMLSTLFLLSRETEPLRDLPFAAALESGLAQQQISEPYFAGTTDDGDVLTMTARAARPAEDGRIEADELAARMLLSDGSALMLDAPSAVFEDAEERAHLSGGVRIESSQGYVVSTNALLSSVVAIDAESLGPVKGAGPVGQFEAGKLRIRPADGGQDVQMLFSGGVKLVYEPPEEESSAE